MDHFGIGAAVRGAIHIVMQAARGTGRTISMLDSVKDGDRICFAHAKEASRVERLLKERGINAECVVVNPNDPGAVMNRGTAQGRFLFDHTWVELYYLRAIERAEKDIDDLQRACTGFGEAHRETQRRAAELARWRL